MVSPDPHYVEFWFFDGSRIRIPNFAEMQRQFIEHSLLNAAIMSRDGIPHYNEGQLLIGKESGDPNVVYGDNLILGYDQEHPWEDYKRGPMFGLNNSVVFGNRLPSMSYAIKSDGKKNNEIDNYGNVGKEDLWGLDADRVMGENLEVTGGVNFLRSTPIGENPPNTQGVWINNKGLTLRNSSNNYVTINSSGINGSTNGNNWNVNPALTNIYNTLGYPIYTAYGNAFRDGDEHDTYVVRCIMNIPKNFCLVVFDYTLCSVMSGNSGNDKDPVYTAKLYGSNRNDSSPNFTNNEIASSKITMSNWVGSYGGNRIIDVPNPVKVYTNDTDHFNMFLLALNVTPYDTYWCNVAVSFKYCIIHQNDFDMFLTDNGSISGGTNINNNGGGNTVGEGNGNDSWGEGGENTNIVSSNIVKIPLLTEGLNSIAKQDYSNVLVKVKFEKYNNTSVRVIVFTDSASNNTFHWPLDIPPIPWSVIGEQFKPQGINTYNKSESFTIYYKSDIKLRFTLNLSGSGLKLLNAGEVIAGNTSGGVIDYDRTGAPYKIDSTELFTYDTPES